MSNFLYAVEREYPVSVDTMWLAWTDAVALESWYSPTTLSVVPGTVVSEPRDLTVPHHVIHIDIESRGDVTWAKFSQFGELPDGQAEQAQAGMESYFDNLGAYLAR